MADALSLQLNIENSLVQTLQQTQTVMKAFNSNLEKAQKNFQNMDKSADKIVDHYDDIEKSQKKIAKSTTDWGKSLSKIGGFVKQIAGGFLAIFSTGGLLNMLKQTISLDDAMKDLSYQMGEGGRTAQALKNSVYEASDATGIATEKMGQLVTQLKELRVPTENMTEMAINTGRFAEVSGVSADNAARLTGELMRTGRLGAQATTDILAGMVSVQRAVGMTSGEMQELSEGIIESTMRLNQMGKSAGQIENFNKGVVKLAAAFTQVGLSAADANKFVSELLDPGRVEDNAFLYAKLGVSLEDAFSGNVDPGVLASRFKDLGNEMRDMSGPAAAAMAEQLGMPLGQLRQMAEMDMSQLQETFAGGASGAEQLADAQSEQLSAQDRFEKSMNRVSNTIQGLMDKLMPLIEAMAKAFEWLVGKGTSAMKSPLALMIVGAVAAVILLTRTIRRRFMSVATDTKKAISTAIMEGMNQGSQHGAAMMRENVSGRAIDRQTRVRQGSQFGGMQDTANEFDSMAGGNLTSGVRSMTENTASWLRNVSAGARPVSRLTALTEDRNKAMMDTLGFARQEASTMKGIFNTRKEMAQQTRQDLQGRVNYLKSINKSAEQEWELKKLKNQMDKAGARMDKADAEMRREKDRLYDREERVLKSISEEQLRSLAIEQGQKRQSIEANISGYNDQVEKLRASQSLLEKNMEENKGNYMITKQLQEEYDKIGAAIAEQQTGLAVARRELGDTVSEAARFNRIAQGRGIGDVFNPNAVAKSQSVWRRTGRFIQTSFTKAGLKITESFDKARNSARQIGRNLAQRLNPRNLVAGVRQRFSAQGRQEAAQRRQEGGGGTFGKIAKMLGPIMLIMRLLGRIEPIQKVMADIMEKVKPILQRLGEVLGPAIQRIADIVMPIIDNLISALMPLVEVLLNAIEPILAAIFPALIELVKVLLPPLITVLGWVLQIVGKAVEIIGKLVKVMLELPIRIGLFFEKEFRRGSKEERAAMVEAQVRETRSQSALFNAAYGVAESVEEIGGAVYRTGVEMANMKWNFDDIPDKVAQGVEDGVAEGMSTTVTTTITPAMLEAAAGGLSVERDIERNTTTSIAGSTEATAEGITTTVEQDAERNRMMSEQTMAQRELATNQQQTNTLLQGLADSINNLAGRMGAP